LCFAEWLTTGQLVAILAGEAGDEGYTTVVEKQAIR
jgi:hypothetical protein